MHPKQVPSRLYTQFLMLPRSAANSIYGDAISQRAPFDLLSQGDNIETLPDGYGSTSSPGGMEIYRNPLPVYQKLKRRGLVSGRFDAAAYHAAERADLEAAGAKTEEIRTQRRAAIDALSAAS